LRSLNLLSRCTLRKLTIGVAAAAGTVALSGCLDKGFFDQTEMGAFNKDAMIVPVLDNLSTGVEEPDDVFGQAEEPTAEDLQADTLDYAIGPYDLVNITISDLRGPGLDDLKQVRVTSSGKVSLPNINQISIGGMTEAQAEEAISKAYRDAQIIQNAQVSVVVSEARGSTFSIVGAVGRAGQYPILKNDFRLLDAFTVSADFDVTRGTRGYEYVYIIRKNTGAAMDDAPNAAPNGGPADNAQPPADVLRPRSQAKPADMARAAYMMQPAEQPPEQPTQPATTAAPWWSRMGQLGSIDEQPTQPATTAAPAQSGEGRYVIIDGKPVLVGGGPVAPAETPAAEMPAENVVPTEMPGVNAAPATMADPTKPFEFNAPQEPSDVRVIRIPMTKLVQGQLKYNIIIRPGDTIFVPNPLEGVYYMGGHVQRVGVYSLGGGNKVSLMDAIIAAGGLDQVAVPWRTQVIRRIQGADKQIFATVDLTKIFNGEEPDLYLKKDDKIIVGTQFWAPFLAASRNAFRITYGFGFLYDRNYAPRQDGL